MLVAPRIKSGEANYFRDPTGRGVYAKQFSYSYQSMRIHHGVLIYSYIH